MEKYKGLEKLEELRTLLEKATGRLEEIEYLVKLLESEIESYESLIDRESLIPKLKFVKYKLKRLLARLKHGSEEVLICAGIKVEILGENIPLSEKKVLFSTILSYLDNRIRPTDILFEVNGTGIGIIFSLKCEKDEEAVINRLKQILLHIKTKTYSEKNVLVNFNLNYFRITKDSDLDDLLNKLESSLRG